MNRYNKVVFGATAFSAGLSTILDENDIIIEKNIFTGAEFCQNFNAKPIDMKADYCDTTKALLKDLKQRNILDDDGCYSAIPVSAVLSSYFLKSKATVLLDCVVTNIKKEYDGFVIEYFGESGFCEISAKEIIDTTDVGILNEAISYPFEYQVGTKKHYIANIDGYNGKTGDFEIIKGHLQGEYYLKINAEELDLIESRAHLVNVAQEYNFKITSFAAAHTYEYKTPYRTIRTRNHYFVPSVSFGSFAEAFHNGAKGVYTK